MQSHMKHYLDYNATAPARPEVLDVMQELQKFALNPSSVHENGRKAKGILDNSRRKIAEAIGVFANEIIFVSSGTEANNWAIKAFPEHKIIVSAIEHSSVLKTAGTLANTFIIPVDSDGIINLDAFAKALPQGKFLVSIMLANNETGVIQPVQEIAGMVHKRGGLMHCDAVQAFGKVHVDFTALGCDLMTISAHKMGGPVGAAALIARNNLPLAPMLIGGGQELNRRAGTENVAAIAGFAKAAECIDLKSAAQIRPWLDAFEQEVEKLGSRIIGKNATRLPNTSCITMPNVTAETQLISFDLEGIAVSAGSACSSGRIEPSHVLKAMGIDTQEAATAIRASGGWGTQEANITALTEAWKKLFQRKNERAA